MGLITLLRHAPLPKEYQKRYIGHSDIFIDNTLTDVSLINNLKSRTYDLVYSSDLKRCTQTLDLISKEYIPDKRLREVKFKDCFEKKSFSEIEKMDIYDEKYLDSHLTWHEFICDESFEGFKNRIKSFLDTLPIEKDILICSHGGTIKMISSILTSEDYSSQPFSISYLEYIDLIIT